MGRAVCLGRGWLVYCRRLLCLLRGLPLWTYFPAKYRTGQPRGGDGVHDGVFQPVRQRNVGCGSRLRVTGTDLPGHLAETGHSLVSHEPQPVRDSRHFHHRRHRHADSGRLQPHVVCRADVCPVYVGIFAGYMLVLNRENRRFPWKKTMTIVIPVLLLLAFALYLSITRYGMRLVPHWPFLTR